MIQSERVEGRSTQGSYYSPVTPGEPGSYPMPLDSLRIRPYSTTEGNRPTLVDCPLSVSSAHLLVQPGDRGDSGLPQKVGEDEPNSYLDQTTANLLNLSDYQEVITSCTPRYLVYACKCGRHVVKSCCMSLRCPECAPRVGDRRAKSIFDRLKTQKIPIGAHIRQLTVIYTVFTVPEAIRQRFIEPHIWSGLRKKVWKLLKDKYGALYGMEATHPIGDKDKDKFHPHLNYLWIQRPGYRPYIDVSTLRLDWARLLGVDNADIKSAYSSNSAKIMHWCRYVSRVFVGLHKWTGPVRWYGQYPRKPRPEPNICPDCGQEYKYLGWIEAILVDDYYPKGLLSGLDPPWERDQNIHWGRKGESNHGYKGDAADDIHI